MYTHMPVMFKTARMLLFYIELETKYQFHETYKKQAESAIPGVKIKNCSFLSLWHVAHCFLVKSHQDQGR